MRGYVPRNERGEIFEYRDLPAAYLHGGGSGLFPQIEQALEGRTVGERVSASTTPRLTFSDDIENVPEELRRAGLEFEAANAKGESRMFRVTCIAEGRFTVDANHPLAGQSVSFEVKVVGVRDATAEELASGRPAEIFPHPLL